MINSRYRLECNEDGGDGDSSVLFGKGDGGGCDDVDTENASGNRLYHRRLSRSDRRISFSNIIIVTGFGAKQLEVWAIYKLLHGCVRSPRCHWSKAWFGFPFIESRVVRLEYLGRIWNPRVTLHRLRLETLSYVKYNPQRKEASGWPSKRLVACL